MDQIDRIRAFNRHWTRALGILGKSYLGSGLGLAEVRLLHDLDAAGGDIRARDLASALGLDEAQVSRSLHGFAARGWLERAAGPDRRARHLRLTAEGRAEAARLKAESRAAIAALLAGMAPVARAGLTGALVDAAEALEPPEVALDALRPGDAGWVIARHAELYARDEGYDASFEGLVAQILGGFLQAHDPARERGWIARSGARRLGSIFVMAEDAETARLRLVLVEPEARGTGLAQRMLDAALSFARAAGYRRMLLWTHESHRAAGRLYARNGFALTAAAPARAFGCDVVDQTWERAL